MLHNAHFCHWQTALMELEELLKQLKDKAELKKGEKPTSKRITAVKDALKKAVGQDDKIATVKSFETFSSVLNALASDGQTDLFESIVQIVDPCSRLGVYRCSNKDSPLHFAAQHEQPEVIALILSTLPTEQEKLTLALHDGEFERTALDCSVCGKTINRSVSEALLQSLSEPSQQTLIQNSSSYHKLNSENNKGPTAEQKSYLGNALICSLHYLS